MFHGFHHQPPGGYLRTAGTFLKRVQKAIGCLLILACLPPAVAQSEDFLKLPELKSISDSWHAFRRFMDDTGILLETINTIDVLSTVSGGLRQRTAAAGDFDILLTLDGKRLLGWDEATLFVYGLGLYGDDPSENVGDFQGVSGIAASNTWKLFEFWYQHNFMEKRFSLLAGLYDVTSEFDVIRTSSELFLNSSFGTGGVFAASGINGPSTFPNTTLGLRGQAFVTNSLAIRAVVTDGVPGDPDNPGGTQILLKGEDGIFANGEIAYYVDKKRLTEKRREGVIKERPLRKVFQRVGRAAPVEYDGKYAVGFWGYTTSFNDVSEVDSSGNPVVRNGTYGMYALAEQNVFLETLVDDQGLTLFAALGLADPQVNRFSQFYGGGAVYRGLIPGRDLDELGFGVASTIHSDHYVRGQQRAGQSVDKEEITLEFTYTFNLFSPYVVIQPDLQYIINPDTNPSVPNALVMGARIQLNLSWFESLAEYEEYTK